MRILLKGLRIYLKSLCEIALLKLLITRVLKRYLCCMGKGNEEAYCENYYFHDTTQNLCIVFGSAVYLLRALRQRPEAQVLLIFNLCQRAF